LHYITIGYTKYLTLWVLGSGGFGKVPGLSEIIQHDVGFPTIPNTIIFNMVSNFICIAGYCKYLTLWVLGSRGFGKVLHLSEIFRLDVSYRIVKD
jgi:hypothetical protein